MTKQGFGCFLYIVALLFAIGSLWLSMNNQAEARNVYAYSDSLEDSGVATSSNHTFQFTTLKDIAAGGSIQLDFPSGFIIPASTSTFGVRNVELFDDGSSRTASDTLTASLDQVVINPGDGGSITYNLNTTNGIAADSVIRVLVGNHTSNSNQPYLTYSTSTGTTTVPGDAPPIRNSDSPGTHKIDLSVTGTSEEVSAQFHVAVVPKVTLFGDTTETIPPYRFNGAPTSTIGGTTLNVEISLETNELAICKYDTASGTPYAAMPETFGSTGFLVHSQVVPVTPSSVNTFYVRCIDDEDNFNTDDYVISFSVNDQPTGTANDEGTVDGDGTGSGNQGTGSGTGGGGTVGGSSGTANNAGSSSGGGGSGGGSGGDEGEDDEDDVGGGFGNDGPYRSGDANVIISGYAFPGSTVSALVDGTVTETVTVGSDGSYEVTIEDIARGVYTFGIYATDENDVKSTTFSTSFTVTGGRTSELSNVNVMPSILVTPDPVDVGTDVLISGFSIPNAEITIENQKDGSDISLKTFNTTSNSDGEWSIVVETGAFSEGTYKVRAKALQSGGLGVKTNFSGYTFYGVGQDADVPLNADLNEDGSVNLTDFSILLFWWGGDGGDSNPPADINRDGSVSLTDFSIMLFQWTG